MAGNGISGVGGDAKTGGVSIAEIKKWNAKPKITTPQYASNKTGGYKRTVPGVKSITGVLNGVVDTANPFQAALDVGAVPTLELDFKPTIFYSVPSVIGDADYTVDLDNGDIITGDISFVGNGAWTNPIAGLVAPMGRLPLPDGSMPEGSLPVTDPRALAMLNEDQLGAVIQAFNEMRALRSAYLVEKAVGEEREKRAEAADKAARGVEDTGKVAVPVS